MAINHVQEIYLLNTQYRMRKTIAGFSSQYFYNNLLHTAEHLHDTGTHITFIDSAGSGYNEKHGPDGISLQNEGELNITRQVLEQNNFNTASTAFISPIQGRLQQQKIFYPQGFAAVPLIVSRDRSRKILLFHWSEATMMAILAFERLPANECGHHKSQRTTHRYWRQCNDRGR